MLRSRQLTMTAPKGRRRSSMHQNTMMAGIVAGLVLLASFSSPATAQADFISLYDAVISLNLNLLDAVVKLSSMVDTLNRTDFQAILLAPTDAAWKQANTQVPTYALSSTALGYHILPMQGVDNPTLPTVEDDVTLPTWLTSTNTDSATNPNVTLRRWNNNSPLRYMGGLAPGVIVNISKSYTAGKGRVYLLDTSNTILMPPSTSLFPNMVYGLSVASALASNQPVFQGLGLFTAMLNADPVILALANDENWAVTMFAPTDTAIRAYLKTANLDEASFPGSPAAHQLLQLHIVPSRPYASSDFAKAPGGSTLMLSMSRDQLTVSSSGNGFSVYGPNNFQPVPVQTSDVLAGKSIIQIISSSVLIPTSGQLTPGGPVPAPPPPGGSAVIGVPTGPEPGSPPTGVVTQQGSSSKSNIGAIAGGAVGGVVAALLAAIAFGMFLLNRRKAADSNGTEGGKNTPPSSLPMSPSGPSSPAPSLKQCMQPTGTTDTNTNTDSVNVEVYVDNMQRFVGNSFVGTGPGATGHAPVVKSPTIVTNNPVAMVTMGGPSSRQDTSFQPSDTIPGLIPGDPFIRSTAPQYSWCHSHIDSSYKAVEAYINDSQLDKLAPAKSPCPVIRLSKQDVVSQIELMSRGLLGRGAHGLVFKCRWPSRFGPKSLLAVKVLKDPYEGSNAVLNTYAYEASLLASIRHPHVVRMYGFCLELPCVCIVMELMPYTLKHRLYSRQPRLPAPQSSPTPAVAPAAHGKFFTGKEYRPPGSSQYHRQSMDKRRSNESRVSRTEHDGRRQSGTYLPRVELTEQLSSSSNVVQGRKGTRMSLAEVLQISSDIACGLAYLHKRPVAEPLPVDATYDMSGMMPTPEDVVVALSVNSNIQDLQSAQSNVLHNSTAHTSDQYVEYDEDGDVVHDSSKTVARIVHRDLKPSNILISSKGRAKLSDFGLSREHNDTTVFTNQFGVGTLRYMAPELLVGYYSGPYAQHVTNRVDIYSLGMVMWEMLNNQMPWHDMSDTQILAAVIGRKRPHLSSRELPSANATGSRRSIEFSPEVTPGVPSSSDLQAHFRDIIRACWQQRELKRPTAESIHRRIAELLVAMKRVSISRSTSSNVLWREQQGLASTAHT